MTNSPNQKPENGASVEELESRVALLKEISFFRDEGVDNLKKIANYLVAKSISSGTQVLTQDQPVDGVYFLQSGEVQILVSNEQSGQEELITHGYKGECFGEMSTLRGDFPASATVLTTTESRFLYIERTKFLRIVDEFNLWPKFVNVLASRLEQTNHRMTEVMKHLKQGMVQVDPIGQVTGKFSMGFVRIIGADVGEIHGESFPKLVFADSETAMQKWKDNFSLAIMSNPDQAELILNLLPEECDFQHPELGKRIFKISYDLCVYNKKVIGMDIGLEDVTRVRELAQKSLELEKEKGIVKEIFTKPETFRTLLNLLEDVRSDLMNAENAIDSRIIDKEDVRSWFGNMHSLKGTSNFLKLVELGNAAHEMENVLDQMRSANLDDYSLLKALYLEKREYLEDQIVYVNEILEGMGEETKKRLTAELVMSRNETEVLEKAIDQTQPAYEILQKAKKIPSIKLVEGWKDELERICQKLSKKIVFRAMGESIPLPGDVYNSIKVPLVHLLRNCAEHGVETVEQRKKLKKPSVGLISFKAEVEDHQYLIHIQDNGKGIKKENILEKAKLLMEKDTGLKPRIQQLLDEGRILAILFLPGFSTSEEVTELSGRGVGLDVVQKAASSVNGSISMKTVPLKGTKFTLSFPR